VRQLTGLDARFLALENPRQALEELLPARTAAGA
jgi:hypothetical protein